MTDAAGVARKAPAPSSGRPGTLSGLRLWSWAAIVLGVALRMFRPLRHSLWSDEGNSLIFAEGSLSEVVGRLAEARTSEHFQPLYFLLLQPWLRLSRSDLGVKALGIGLSILALLAFHRCSRRLVGERAGMLSTVFFALSAFQVYYAQEVRPYALISLVTVAQLWAYSFVRAGAEEGRNRWRLAAFASINGVAVFASLFQVFFLVALSLADLALTARSSSVGSRVRDWLVRWGPSVVATAPAMAFFLLTGPSATETVVPRGLANPVEGLLYSGFGLLFGSTLAPPAIELRGSGRLETLLASWPALALAGIAGAGLLWAVVRRWRPSGWKQPVPGRETAASILTLATALGFVLFLVFAWLNGVQWLPRHSAFASPLLALVVGFHLSELGFSSHRREKALGGTVLACLVLANVWSLERYYFDDRYLKDDYRAVGRLLANDPPIPALMVWGNVRLLQRYGGSGVWGFRDLAPQHTAEELRRQVGPGDEAFLVVNRPYYWTDRPVEELVPGYDVTERIDMPGFRIFRLRGTDPPSGERPTSDAR